VNSSLELRVCSHRRGVSAAQEGVEEVDPVPSGRLNTAKSLDEIGDCGEVGTRLLLFGLPGWRFTSRVPNFIVLH